MLVTLPIHSSHCLRLQGFFCVPSLEPIKLYKYSLLTHILVYDYVVTQSLKLKKKWANRTMFLTAATSLPQGELAHRGEAPDHHALGPSKSHRDMGNFRSSTAHTWSFRVSAAFRGPWIRMSATLRIPHGRLCLFDPSS